jgi:hypothetical protein
MFEIIHLSINITAKRRETLRLNAAYTALKTYRGEDAKHRVSTSIYFLATLSLFRLILSAQFHPRSLYQTDF